MGHVKAMARENVISLAIKASLIFLGATTIIVAISFLMYGTAKGISNAFGFDPWLGSLITGAVFLLAASLLFTFISFMARKESLKRKAEQKEAAETLARKFSELVDIKKWTREYPLYSTGAAAAAGFTLSGAISPAPCQTPNLSEEPRPEGIQSPIIAMVLALAEDILKEAVVPFVKEQLKPKEDPRDTPNLTQ